MSNVLKHKFVTAKSDPPDTTLVRPSNWNDEHVFAGGSANTRLVWNAAQTDKVSWVDEIYNVAGPPYNADMTGAVSGRVALQNAINDAQASTTSRKKVVYIPEGTLLLDSEITFKEHNGFTRYPITVCGARAGREGSGSIIKASPSFSSAQMFRFIENGGGSLNAHYNLKHFTVNGNQVANLKAFEIQTMSYCKIIDISVIETPGRVFNFGQVEVLLIADCNFSGNGDVLYFGTDVPHNAIRIFNNEFSSNSGWAIHFGRGTGLTIEQNTFQSNAKGALYLSRLSSFAIRDNHFEENGTGTGQSYLTPATGLIKADIHFNGDDGLVDTVLDPDEFCEGGVIEANLFSSGSPTYHIFANALSNTRIENNLVAPNQKLIGTWGSKQYSYLKDLRIIDNDNNGLSTDIDVSEGKHRIQVAASFGTDNFNNPNMFHSIDYNLPPINFLDIYTMNRWGQIVTLGAGNFARIADGEFVFRISAVGPTHVFGVTLATSSLPGDIIGKWLWFGCWGNLSTVTNNSLAFYVTLTGATGIGYSHQSSTGDIVGSRFRSVGFLVPNGTTEIKVGVQQFGSGGGVVDIWQPILTYVGVPYHKIRESLTNQWYGTAAPTAGVWNTGDIIWKTNPSAGAEPGYMCVSGGTPGTWKNMANLAA